MPARIGPVQRRHRPADHQAGGLVRDRPRPYALHPDVPRRLDPSASAEQLMAGVQTRPRLGTVLPFSPPYAPRSSHRTVGSRRMALRWRRVDAGTEARRDSEALAALVSLLGCRGGGRGGRRVFAGRGDPRSRPHLSSRWRHTLRKPPALGVRSHRTDRGLIHNELHPGEQTIGPRPGLRLARGGGESQWLGHYGARGGPDGSRAHHTQHPHRV